MAMTRSDFLQIAEYGNENWKGSFTPEEVSENAELYYAEYAISNEQGKATHAMEELCKLLIEDINGGSDEAYDFLKDIMLSAEWRVEEFICTSCKKREIVFFSKEELDNLNKHSQRKMLIQDAIPDKPQWIRETFITEICKCPECWAEYWGFE